VTSCPRLIGYSIEHGAVPHFRRECHSAGLEPRHWVGSWQRRGQCDLVWPAWLGLNTVESRRVCGLSHRASAPTRAVAGGKVSRSALRSLELGRPLRAAILDLYCPHHAVSDFRGMDFYPGKQQ
jgi:hypothetical protein